MADTDQNQQKQDRRPTIEILTDNPAKGDDVWELTVWAIFRRGNTPTQGVTLRFLCNGKQVGSEVTDGDGRTDPCLVTAPRNATLFTIEVYADANPPGYNKKRVDIPKQPALAPADKKGADDWKVRANGSNGKYELIISVISQDRTPVGGVLITVFNPQKEGQNVEGRTDADGRLTLKLPDFTEASCEVLVEAFGTAFEIKRLYLYGPPAQLKDPMPNYSYNMTWSPWDILHVIRWYWQRAGEDNKNKKGQADA